MSHIYCVTQFAKSSELWPAQALMQAENMTSVSQYWQPELRDQRLVAAPTPLIVGQLLRFNTPQSRFEQVHIIDNGMLYVVANARLDNREALFSLLRLAPNTKLSDGLLIGLLYQRLGTELLQHLLGDFAFIIWDERQQQLFAASDHFGVKNLFYGYCDLGLMVTNEHKALLTAEGMDNRINPDYLARQWLTLPDIGYVSPCMGIKSIPPAHYLLANRDGAHCHRYWQLADMHYSEFSNREQSIAGLRQRFELAVKRRLQTEFPVGAELSEGLDSTAVCAVAAQAITPAPVLSFSYECIPPNNDNAATYADILDFVAMYDNIQPQWREAEPEQSEAELNQAISEAFGAPAPKSGQWLERYPLIMDAGVRTLLSGWGGDHCVTGYADFFEDELLKRGKVLSLYRLLKQKYQRGRGGRPVKAVIRLLLKHNAPGLYRRFFLVKHPMMQHLRVFEQALPLKSDLISATSLEQHRAFINQFDLQSVKARDRRELFEIGVHWRLIGSEVAGRFFRLDYRFPMLDKELVEYAYNMPAAYKIWQGFERAMFRDAITGLVTERIRLRLKSEVALPTGQKQKNLSRRREQLVQLTNMLQDHPLIHQLFDEDNFRRIPKNFADMPMAAIKLQTLLATCQLYDAGILKQPANYKR